MKAADWRNLVERILNSVDGPVELDDLVSVAKSLLHVNDSPEDNFDAVVEPSIRPRIVEQLHQREVMKQLWLILQDFEHRWLMALLLNLPGYTRAARGEIESFEASGAATSQDIGKLLGLTGREYHDLRDKTSQWPADPGSPEGRMTDRVAALAARRPRDCESPRM